MEQIVILPARERVAEEIRKAIFEEELVKGQELSQEKISKQLGISRMPVREAFQILEREGLISIKNRRAIVIGLCSKDIIDHIEIRALLEGEAARRACLGNKDFDQIYIAHKKAKQAIINNDNREFSVANEEFHKAIWTASDSFKLESLLIQLWDGLPPHLPVLLPDQKDQSIIEHEAIVNALNEREAEKARAAMSGHLLSRINILKTHFNNTK